MPVFVVIESYESPIVVQKKRWANGKEVIPQPIGVDEANQHSPFLADGIVPSCGGFVKQRRGYSCSSGANRWSER